MKTENVGQEPMCTFDCDAELVKDGAAAQLPRASTTAARRDSCLQPDIQLPPDRGLARSVST